MYQGNSLDLILKYLSSVVNLYVFYFYVKGCSFKLGKAIGSNNYYEGLDRTATDDECATLVRSRWGKANGAMRYQENGFCSAAFEATGIDDNPKFKTCLFDG